MSEIPTFWQAFEAVARILLMLIGAAAPLWIVALIIMVALEHRRIRRWWRGQ